MTLNQKLAAQDKAFFSEDVKTLHHRYTKYVNVIEDYVEK